MGLFPVPSHTQTGTVVTFHDKPVSEIKHPIAFVCAGEGLYRFMPVGPAYLTAHI